MRFDGWPWHEKLRVVTGELGANYWLWQQPDQVMHSGFHVGPYAAIYRYDFLFGSKGQEAKANWGVGVNCGYSVALNRHLSFDFTLGLGYVGGKYKEYEPSDDISGHNVWTADKIRHYVGPTKAEIALVWHILGPVRKSGKGGNRLAPSVCMATGRLGEGCATECFACNAVDATTLQMKFRIFGHCPDYDAGVLNTHLLTIYAILADGSKWYYTTDVTTQMHKEQPGPDPEGDDEIDADIDGLPIPKPIVNGGGFQPLIDGWQSIEIEVGM